jgi:alcohol dehydrogenase (cytochrome c)
VSRLVKVCAYSFPDKEPSNRLIVSGGRMYLTTAHYTVAVDGANCHVIWSSKWTPREHEPANTHRGAALADGKIIRGTNDGFLLALDAKDGHTLWAKQIADPKEGYFISMPPLVHGNLIYIGPAGSETAARGWVGAFRISDGEQLWRFNIVPDDGEAGADTWGRILPPANTVAAISGLLCLLTWRGICSTYPAAIPLPISTMRAAPATICIRIR